MKYRKKPVVIEAEQYFDNQEVGHWPSGICKSLACYDYPHIHTLEGHHIVTSGDWIITGVKGEKYPCKPDIFEQTYEPVGQ